MSNYVPRQEDIKMDEKKTSDYFNSCVIGGLLETLL